MPDTLNMTTLEDIAAEGLQGTVSDVMTKDVRTVPLEATITQIADVLAKNRLRRVVVVDARQQVQGVISQHDVLRHVMFSHQADGEDSSGCNDSAEATAQSLLGYKKPVIVLPSVPLVKAAAVLAKIKISCLLVVDQQQCLKGLLTVTDLFRYITEHIKETVESDFQIYTPLANFMVKSPAYIRRLNGDLVIPYSSIEETEKLTEFVLMGYDAANDRILVKFVEKESQTDDALKIKREKENLVIPAQGFVTHFGLSGKASAFSVSYQSDGNYLVLTPKADSSGAESCQAAK